MRTVIWVAMLAAGASLAAQGIDPQGSALRIARQTTAALTASLPPGTTLRETRTFVEGDQTAAHVRLQQYFKGVPVFEGEAIVHVDLVARAVRGTTDALKRFAPIGVVPAISRDEARRRAIPGLRRPDGIPQGTGWTTELALVDDDGAATLVWMVRATADDGVEPLDAIVMVDAQQGTIRRAWDDVRHIAGTGDGFFSGSVTVDTASTWNGFVLRDPERGNHRTVDMRNRWFSFPQLLTDADNAWGSGVLSDRQSIAVDAHYGAAQTWDYYAEVHARRGVADDGRGTSSRVHYGFRYSNAYWSDACFCMTYGDGNGTSINPLVTLDVAGHEMTHGVTSRTANLTYISESGGLNEATSDIFGTMVEFFAANPNDAPDYEIGERIYAVPGLNIRTMINPSDDGVSADCWYPQLGRLDVHYSSGVANHFFYLLAEGTTSGAPSATCVAGNTRVATGQGTLIGIGRSAAERIWYRALTVYMTAGTNYVGARAATLDAANDLFGPASVESQAVAAAWSAVGLP